MEWAGAWPPPCSLFYVKLKIKTIMHSRIFQVSLQPVKMERYAVSSDFYDNSSDFADYIGAELDRSERREDIGYLAEALSDIFDFDKRSRVLVYKGEEAMEKFKGDWAAAIREKAEVMTADNILDWYVRYRVEKLCSKTHLDISYRFCIVDWCDGVAEPMEGLIGFVAQKMKKGDKLYVGAVIDFHF